MNLNPLVIIALVWSFGRQMFISAQKCPDHPRTVNSTDSVFLTIDDGPSYGSRHHLLKAFREANVRVTFFESGYNLCNDLISNNCQKWAYEDNIANLAQTVKDGHMLAAHSDNHYYDAVNDKCTYLGVPPQVRPASRLAKCGNKPIQNMVQGAHQVQLALQSRLIKWTKEELPLQIKAIDDIWTYSRLPCSDIWRTRSGFSETNLPGVRDRKEKTLRDSIADTMFSGEVTCRPDRYKGIPWENYGFDSDVDWKGATVLDKGEACRIVKLIEDNMESEKSPEKRGKLVLLTHDYYFNTTERANVFKNVAKELVRKGYRLKTMEDFDETPRKIPDVNFPIPTAPPPTVKPTVKPEEVTCIKHKVKSGESTYKIIKNLCNPTKLCTSNGDPSLTNLKGESCPTLIAADEVVEVCCAGLSGGYPRGKAPLSEQDKGKGGSNTGGAGSVKGVSFILAKSLLLAFYFMNN